MTGKSLKQLLLSLVIFCVLISGAGIACAEEIDKKGISSSDYFKSIMDMAQDRYKGEIDRNQMIEGALKGIFNTMDSYTVYYTMEEAEGFFTNINGTYSGIGVVMLQTDGKVLVERVYSSSPAEEAGIKSGDVIVEVDGKSIEGLSLDEVSGLIKGPEGTKVVIGLLRGGTGQIIRLEVTRKQIILNPVTYKIEGDIGYIKLETFNSHASKAMDEALKEMDKNNIKKIVLDLRDNPGGDVSQAVAIARKFVKSGLITKLDFKSESQKDEEYYSNLNKLKYELAVLVNENSASASEILAGAIQDSKSGILVGTTTFGKGKVQNLYPILTPEAVEKYEKETGEVFVNGYDLLSKHGIYPSDDEIIGWVKITTGEYYTPNGRMIDGVGLEPDVYVENEPEEKYKVLENVKKLRKVTKPSLNTESEDVLNAESILLVLGYDVDTPDNLMDEKTVRAVAQFQKDCGLYSYGVLDFATQQALNDKLDELILVNYKDKQYEKAVNLLKN
ncbi:MAG TPA: S41 family peptidase [Acetivibrio sp.]|uniref:S41 family peptidase n=1 Tax=Acetivibrio sp. TaxID=1872092 RepID=UPI002CBFBA79|nr:S41 family peptidase [Acetivibrio sp.]HOM02226.1 S41 family peptidase [Acetivibrio sp.]